MQEAKRVTGVEESFKNSGRQGYTIRKVRRTYQKACTTSQIKTEKEKTY